MNYKIVWDLTLRGTLEVEADDEDTAQDIATNQVLNDCDWSTGDIRDLTTTVITELDKPEPPPRPELRLVRPHRNPAPPPRKP
jgi:hypothetical protein